jgi:hypothetical protein
MAEIYWQVEQHLFKIPRAAFSGLPIFDEMFTLPQSGTPDGTDNEHPLNLGGVTAEEFRPFARAASSQYVLAVKALRHHTD